MRPVTALLALLSCAFACAGLKAKECEETVVTGSSEVYIKKIQAQEKLSPDYKATETTYFLYVPDGYDAKRSYPLVLCISPGDSGRGMYGGWSDVCKKHAVFFVCPNKAGNPQKVDIRGQMALDAMTDARAKYNIDPEQLYVTGFSGGGRMSTSMVAAFPNLFAGHIPMGGIVFQGLDDLKKLKTRYGHYIFAGETCMNRKESEAAAELFKKANIPCELMIGAGMAHQAAKADQTLTMYEWFLTKANQRAALAMKPKFDAAQALDKAGQSGKALAAYEGIAQSGIADPVVTEAQKRAAELKTAAEQRLAKAQALPGPDAVVELQKLATEYAGSSLSATADELRQKIAADPKTASLSAEREKETLEKNAKEALAKAAALEKSNKLPAALDAYEAVTRNFNGTVAAAEAASAAERLKNDPRVTVQRNEAEAQKLLKLANNFLSNGAKDEAREVLQQIVAKYAGCDSAAAAKAKLEQLK